MAKLKVSERPKTKKTDELAKKIQKAHNDLDASEQGEQIMTIAIDWGLTTSFRLIKIEAAAASLSK